MTEINLFPKFIDKAASPVAESVGNTLASVWEIVFGGLDFYSQKKTIKRECALRDFKNSLDEKISNVPSEKLTEPDLHIIGPTLEASKYYFENETLRELFSNLLVSSMHIDFKERTHPSFVEVIKQLSPDEAKMLKLINRTGSHPMIGLRYSIKDNSFKNFFENFSLLPYIADCDNPENGRAYLTNLHRLGLINVDTGTYFVDSKNYKELKEHPFILTQINYLKENNQTFEFKDYSFRLSELGHEFIDVCVEL